MRNFIPWRVRCLKGFADPLEKARFLAMVGCAFLSTEPTATTYQKDIIMHFPKASAFPDSIVKSKIMGPNPLKLCEELLARSSQAISASEDARYAACPFEEGSVVLDLGSGTGITSALLAREYGLATYAVDLWSDPSENMRFFEGMGLSNRDIVPVKADAEAGLPFAHGFFDGVVSIDSYNYFGRDASYLDDKLLPYVKSGGYLCLAIPGMVRDCHDDLPDCLLLSWTPEQLEYMHDMPWWRALLGRAKGAEIVAMFELSCHEEAWADWLACDNEYAQGDAASVRAGALEYLNAIGIVLRKR